MEKHLKDVYGFNQFREYQKDIIQDILNGNNVFAILPTGGGKSLLYQFPATYMKKITVVVSPLISLMNDQCKHLNSMNIKSVCLNSETTVGVSKYTDYQIIYTTPEFIMTRLQAFKMIKDKIGLFAIDEAHCVSQWSHDFRPSYQKLGILQSQFTKIPLLAVTATATPRVLEEMYNYLGVEEASEYLLGTRRTNLEIKVQSKFHFSDCTFNEPTIVYVQTRKLCEKLSLDFNNRGIKSAFYHGGMNKTDKDKSHELFINGDVIVIVATISFGMGIDKSDIRQVINYGVPANIESYYQEIGRAGRDGLNSKAIIYYNDGDFTTTAYLISLSPDPEQIKIKMKGMEIFRSYLLEQNMCRQQMIDYYFATGEFPSEKDVINIPKCGICDNCNRQHTLKMTDLSNEATIIVNTIRNNFIKNGYDCGFKKTIKAIQKSKDNPIIPKKSDKWIKDVIDILITKKILKRYKAGFGFVIGLGSVPISKSLPIEGRIEESKIKMKLNMNNYNYKAKQITKLMELRNKIARKYGLVPSSFINDRVIMNIHDKKPKSISDLWKVDGISNDFIITQQCCEFMEEYKKLSFKTEPKNGGRVKNRDKILSLYKQNKTLIEMANILKLKPLTIENHLFHILEFYDDIDIDPDYFNLSEKREELIKNAIKKIGTKYLRPIKELVLQRTNVNVTYAQIKLCILIMKIEGDFE